VHQTARRHRYWQTDCQSRLKPAAIKAKTTTKG
jgi:hypothetical protein